MNYLVVAQNFINGDPEARSLFAYDTLNEAQIAFHSNLASARSNENISSVLCMVLLKNGVVNKQEYWERESAEVVE